MEIKLRANIVMSKELTIEAEDWTEKNSLWDELNH